jgi:hypothetical protein
VKALFYLVINEGPCALDAKPVFATTDVDVIRKVGELIGRRLGGDAPSRVRALTRPTAPGESDE